MARWAAISLVTAAIGLALVLQGCGGGATTTKAPPGPTAAPGPTTTAAPVATTTTLAPTTTTTTINPDCAPVNGSNLPSCLCQEGFVGACTPHYSPGACYSAKGSGDSWACWGPDQKKTDAECTAESKKGACAYVGHVKKYNDADSVPICENITNFKSQCNPPQDHWGACFDDSDTWLGIAKTKEVMEHYMEGDCQSQVSVSDPKKAFAGVCRFETQGVQQYYKCDTVKSYVDGSCGTNKAACFSTTKGVTWNCVASTHGLPKNCVTQPVNAATGRDTWNGACLIKGEDGYDNAKAWPSENPEVEIV